jgi:nucleoside-diphosphate-sugar epimerase
MKVLVTGNTGFIGSVVTELLGKQALLFRTTDKANDMLNCRDVKSAISYADAVIHTAAIIPGPTTTPKNYGMNILGTRNILDAAVEKGIPVVHASSQAVYNNCLKSPVKEDDPVGVSLGEYGNSKLKSEYICNRFKSIPIAVLRLSTVYGQVSLNQKELLGDMIQQARLGTVNIFGKGKRLIDLVYVKDVAKAMIDMIGKNGVFNVGSGNKMTVKNLAYYVKEKLYPQACIQFDESKHEKQGITLDIAKIQNSISYNPTRFEDGLGFLVI